MPLIVVAAAVFGLTLLAAVVGARVGRKLQARLSDPERFQLFGVQASLLGLLALLLGFSFAMGQTRYDVRRRLVVDEANAIGTSRLRAAAVPEPTGSEIQALLETYVESRLAIVRARTTTPPPSQRSPSRSGCSARCGRGRRAWRKPSRARSPMGCCCSRSTR